MKFSPRLMGVLAAGLVGASSQLGAQAQVRFAGATYGCFYDVPATSCTPTTTASDFFLTFTQGTFNALTSPTGFLGLGGTTNNLGSMALTASTASYTGKFLLEVLFSLPTLTPSNAVYTAAVLGDVYQGNGGVNISFSSPQTFAFNGPDYNGTFTLSVNNISINPNNSPQVVSGFITTSVAPEPGTTALFATGLVGLIPMVRIKRRKLG